VPATPEETSLAVLDMARAGDFAEIRDLFAPPLRSLVTADTLQVSWTPSPPSSFSASTRRSTPSGSSCSAIVDSPDLSPTTPITELPFGVPAPYWLDLRDYQPVEAAATLDIPILILQGGRDYQATVADDLARWSPASPSAPT
jgi:hypothetical protein